MYQLNDEALLRLLASLPARERGLGGSAGPTAETAETSGSGWGAMTAVRGKFGETPLMVATVLRSSRVVRLVLEGAPDDVHVADDSGATALMLAAMKGNAKKVQLLVEAGASSHVRDESQRSALVYALEHGHLNLLDVLVPTMVQPGNQAGREELLLVLLRTIRRKGISLPPSGAGAGTSSTDAPIRIIDAIARATTLSGHVLDRTMTSMPVVHACMVECAYDVLAAWAGAMGGRSSSSSSSSSSSPSSSSQWAGRAPVVAGAVLQFACGCGKGCNEEVARICRGLDACAEAHGGTLHLSVVGGGTAGWGATASAISLVQAACRHRHPSPAVIRKLFSISTMQIGAEAASHGLLELLQTYNNNPQAMLRDWFGGAPPSWDNTWTSPRFLECIDALLEAGADVVTVGHDGRTALEYAVMSLNVEVVTYLLTYCLIKVRELHASNSDAIIARYTVDIDRMASRLHRDECVAFTDTNCQQCLDLSVSGMHWLLAQWKTGSPADMGHYRSVIHENRTAWGHLHIGTCDWPHHYDDIYEIDSDGDGGGDGGDDDDGGDDTDGDGDRAAEDREQQQASHVSESEERGGEHANSSSVRWYQSLL